MSRKDRCNDGLLEYGLKRASAPRRKAGEAGARGMRVYMASGAGMAAALALSGQPALAVAVLATMLAVYVASRLRR